MTKIYQRVLEAQATVERWNEFLLNLDSDDPRFDGALIARAAAVDLRKSVEIAYRRAR